MTAIEDLAASAVEAVVVRPGDTLIIRFASNVTRSTFDAAMAAWDQKLEGVDVLGVNAEQILVYRPDGAA